MDLLSNNQKLATAKKQNEQPKSVSIDNDANMHLPLAVRMRPQKASDILGQDHLLHENSPLRLLIDKNATNSPSSVILWGPAGTGKTTIAYLVSNNTDRHFVELSATSATVAQVRQVGEAAKQRLNTTNQETVLFIDEIHRFSKTQQDVLLPLVENRFIILIGATTENPYFSVINPLLSRSIMLTLKPLSDNDIASLCDRAIRSKNGLNASVKISKDAKDYLVRLSGQDARKALTILESAAAVALASDSSLKSAKKAPKSKPNARSNNKTSTNMSVKPEITIDIISQSIDTALIKYDRQGDSHYDVASAFIKSMRGSDVDAALHYLARMIVSGEDPRFIARRIMIAASEEVSVANPIALQTAVAAAKATEMIGLPEARIILAQAVVEVCLSPKSNATYLGIDRAIADVKAGKSGVVPAHLRDSHYLGAKKIGHGNDYIYAHDVYGGVAKQQYLPDSLKDATYYSPTEYGREKELKHRNEIIKKFLGKTD